MAARSQKGTDKELLFGLGDVRVQPLRTANRAREVESARHPRALRGLAWPDGERRDDEFVGRWSIDRAVAGIIQAKGVVTPAGFGCSNRMRPCRSTGLRLRRPNARLLPVAEAGCSLCVE